MGKKTQSKFTRFVDELNIKGRLESYHREYERAEETMNQINKTADVSASFVSAYMYYTDVLRRFSEEIRPSLNRKNDPLTAKFKQTLNMMDTALKQRPVIQTKDKEVVRIVYNPADEKVVQNIRELQEEINGRIDAFRKEAQNTNSRRTKERINAQIDILNDNKYVVDHFAGFFNMIDITAYEKNRRDKVNAERDAKIGEIVKNTDPDDTVRLYDKGLLKVFAQDALNILDAKTEEKITSNVPEPQESKEIDYLNPADGENILEDITLEEAEAEPQVKEPEPAKPAKEDGIRELLKDVIAYAEMTPTVSSENLRQNDHILFKESSLVKKICGEAEKIFNELQEKPEPSADYDKRLLIAANIMNYFDAEVNGKLNMTAEAEIEDNAVHIRYTGKYIHNKDLDPLLPKDSRFNENSLMEMDLKDQPLFSHEPSPYDIEQGNIGDCYFVAALSEIAAKRPEKIKEMIRDNRDGTCTVRFHQYKNGLMVPFYVTVDKISSLGQAHACTWVQMIERAWAVSGIMTSYDASRRTTDAGGTTSTDEFLSEVIKNVHPVPADIDQQYKAFSEVTDKTKLPTAAEMPWLFDKEGKTMLPWEPDFAQIRAGTEKLAMTIMLGDDCNSEMLDLPGDKVHVNGRTPLDIAQKYTETELEFIRRIKQETELGNMVTAGTLPAPKGDREKIEGINKNHAYSVFGVVPKKFNVNGKEVTRYFVKLRNPHGRSGRTYYREGNQLIAKESENNTSVNYHHDGICFVELKHFMSEFNRITFTNVKSLQEERERHSWVEERHNCLQYRYALSEISGLLGDAGGRMGSNSKEWKNLTREIKSFLDDAPEDYLALREKLSSIETARRKYEKHCIINETERAKETTEARIRKHAITEKLKLIYDASTEGIFASPKAYVKQKIAEKHTAAWMEQNPERKQAYSQNNAMKTAVKRMMGSQYFQNKTASLKNFSDYANELRKNPDVSEISAEIFADKTPDREMTKLGKLNILKDKPAENPNPEKKNNDNNDKPEKKEAVKNEIEVHPENEVRFYM